MSEMQRAADDLRLRNGDPEFLLGMVRQFVDMEPDAKQFPSQLRELRIFFRALDDHLSAGGNPPEAWREGPDAVGASQDEAAARLEYLRGEIRAERISYGEIAELQGLASFIEAGDVELLEWAGVPEAAPGGRDDDYTPEAMDRTE